MQRQNYSIKWLLELKTMNREWFGLVSIISLELSLCVTLSIKKMGFCWWVQRVKKVVSYSPGLLDFAIGVHEFCCYFHNGQVRCFGELKLQTKCNQSCSPFFFFLLTKDGTKCFYCNMPSGGCKSAENSHFVSINS